jgi:hypothetical protein
MNHARDIVNDVVVTRMMMLILQVILQKMIAAVATARIVVVDITHPVVVNIRAVDRVDTNPKERDTKSQRQMKVIQK